MRIISGTIKGRKILVPKGIRPTSERVREALFNILGDWIDNKCLLELYAGSGSVSLEALSRGAKFCWLIEKSKSVMQVLYKNLDRSGFQDKTYIINKDAEYILKHRSFNKVQPDWVFLDPPYFDGKIGKIEKILYLLGTTHILPSIKKIVVQHHRDFKCPSVIETWKLQDQRRYSKTSLSFYQEEII